MKRSTTNRFFIKALRTLCCIGALTTCSAWANVITLQPSDNGASILALKDLPSSGSTNAARGIDTAPATDASNQFSFSTASVSGANQTAASPVVSNDVQSESPSTVSANINVSSKQSEASFSIAESNAQVQPAAGGALASAFDEEFVSVPNVQFASLSAGPNASTASAASVTAVPEMSALFPIVGLIAAVSCTQILRRRRMAQKTAPIA
ncbi:MAG TPA: hypothetical protein VK581_08515 [Chthoniobacterales bacterium]|nr:hypothetical protein [Chthoniobacterales bacterium]